MHDVKMAPLKEWKCGRSRHSRLRQALGAFGLLFGSVVQASTPVMGTIAQDTEWTLAGSPYVLSGQVTVTSAAQLIIDAGVVVQMNAGAGLEVVAGVLSAQGTAASPIKITSASATPARGDWGTLAFDNGTINSGTTLTYVNVLYGHGIVMQAASPTLHNVTIAHHIGPAISIDLQSSPVGDKLTANDNDINGIAVPAGEIGTDVSWLLIGIPYVVQQGSIAVGKRAFGLLPSRLTVAQGATATFELDIPDPAAAGGLTIGTTSNNTSVATTPANVTVSGGVQTASVLITAVAVGLGTITASHAAYGAATAIVDVITPPTVTLSPQSGSVDIGYSLPMTLTLSSVAPAGGVGVALAASDPNLVSVPTQVIVAPGQETAVFQAHGVGIGTALIAATTQSFGSSNASIAVRALSLILPDSVIVPPSGNVNVTLRFSDPAPTGGVTVALTSSATTIATVPASVTVPAGAMSVSFVVAGLVQGTTVLTATASGYTAATSTITVSAISILFNPAGTILLPQGMSQSVQVQLSKAAPAGGVMIALATGDGTVASVWPTAVTVPAGQTNATPLVAVTGISESDYTLTTLTAQSPGLTSGTINIKVEPPVGLALFDDFSSGTSTVVGKGLTNGFIDVELLLSDGTFYRAPAPITIALTSSDPTKVQVPATATIAAQSGSVRFNVSGVDLTATGAPVSVNATAPGFPSPLQPLSVAVVTPQLQFGSLDGSRSAASGRDDFYMNWTVPGGYQNQTATAAQTVSLSVVAANPVGVVPGFHDAAVVGNAITQSTIAAGRNSTSQFAYVDQPATAGSYQVQATLAGVGSWVSPVQIVVANPKLQFHDASLGNSTGPISVGKGLTNYSAQASVTLDVTLAAPLVVSLTSGDPSKVAVPASVTIPAGQNSANFSVSGIDLTDTPVAIDATAPGCTSPALAMSVNVVTPTLGFLNLDTYRLVTSARDNFSVFWSIPNGYGSQTATATQGVSLSITAANPSGIVLGIHDAPTAGNIVAQATIAAGSTASNAVYVDQPLSNGSYQLRADLAGVASGTSATQFVGPIVQISGSPTSITIGQGLAALMQVITLNGSNFIATPPAPVTVNLTSSDPSKVSVPASVTIPALCCGSAQAGVAVSGLDFTTSPVTITLSATGYIPSTVLVNVVAQQLTFNGLDGNRIVGLGQTLDNFNVSLGAGAGSYGAEVALAPEVVTFSIASANPSEIVSGFVDASGNPLTQLTIPAGKGNSCLPSCSPYVAFPTAAGTYRVQAGIGGVGSWTSAVQTVTNAPPAQLGFFNGFGSGVTETVGVGLQAIDAGVTIYPSSATNVVVSLACVDSGVCSVPATVTIPAGNCCVTFPINGIGVGSTQIVSSVPGYAAPPEFDVSVVTPSLQFNALPSALPSGTSAGLSVFTSVSGAYGLQAAVVPMPITLASSNPAVATVPQSVIINAGQVVSGAVLLNGIGPGTMTITASGASVTPITTQPITVQ